MTKTERTYEPASAVDYGEPQHLGWRAVLEPPFPRRPGLGLVAGHLARALQVDQPALLELGAAQVTSSHTGIEVDCPTSIR